MVNSLRTGGGSLREPVPRDLVEEIRVIVETDAAAPETGPKPAYRRLRVAEFFWRLLGPPAGR
jgi:hypothetical protein